MNGARFYFDHSLAGYFFRRAKQKWFKPQGRRSLSSLNYHGVILQLDCLSKGMQDVLQSGGYEAPEMQLIPTLISSSDKILEIGGAIGFLGLYCLKVKGVHTLVTVEPNPKTLSYLRRNYELNGMTPSVIEAAMAMEDGEVSFSVSDMFWADSLFSPGDEPGTCIVTVPGLSFSSLWERAGGQFNALIIDIEGGEKYLAADSIPDSVEKILIEIHPNIIGVRAAYGALEGLIRRGFEIQGHVHATWALMRR